MNTTADAGRRNKVKPRSHAGMLNMHIDTYGDVVHTQMAGDTQRHISIHPIDPDQHTPENESVTPDSPVRGAVSRIGESEGVRSSMDALGACTYMQSTMSDSRTPAHASKYLKTCQKNPNSPGRSAETHTGAREAQKSLVCIWHAHARAQ